MMNLTILHHCNISGIAPVEHRYGEKVKSLSLDTYNILKPIPHTGKEITVDIGIRGQSTHGGQGCTSKARYINQLWREGCFYSKH